MIPASLLIIGFFIAGIFSLRLRQIGISLLILLLFSKRFRRILFISGIFLLKRQKGYQKIWQILKKFVIYRIKTI